MADSAQERQKEERKEGKSNIHLLNGHWLTPCSVRKPQDVSPSFVHCLHAIGSLISPGYLKISLFQLEFTHTCIKY